MSMEEFWPLYLGEHLNPFNRRLHFIGTTAAIVLLAAAAAMRRWEPAAAAPVVAYGLAWYGHFFHERNRPATFRHPVLSLLADLRMYGLILSGRLDAELLLLMPRLKGLRQKSGT